VFCKCLLGRVYTGRKRLQVAFEAPTSKAKPRHLWHLCNVRVPTAPLQCWAVHVDAAMPGYPQHICHVRVPSRAPYQALGGPTTRPHLGVSLPGKSHSHSSSYWGSDPLSVTPLLQPHQSWPVGDKRQAGRCQQESPGAGFFP